MKVPKTSKREDKNYRNILTRYLILEKSFVVMQFVTSSKSQRSKPKGIRNYKP